MTRTAQEALSLIDELTFRNYAHNRMLSPHITPEQWALIYSNVPEMEERYMMASTGNILDVAPQGEKELSNGSIRSDIPFPGSSERSEGLRLCDQRIIGNQQSVPEIQGAGEKHNQLHLSRQAGCVLDVANQGRGIAPSTESITVGIGGEATAIASPLYLLASEIVDVVEFAAQYRAEEEAAAEEGALIEASGYSDPATHPHFA